MGPFAPLRSSDSSGDVRWHNLGVVERVFLAEDTGYGSKLKHQPAAGFSPWFHLLGFQNEFPFLTHSHMGVGLKQ